MATIEKADPFETKRVWAEISKDALLNNLRVIEKRSGKPAERVIAVVKANAYGHDIALVAPLLGEAGVENFAVATIDEAVALRAYAPGASILILGTTDHRLTPELKKYGLTQTVVSDEDAAGFAAASEKAGGPPLEVHLKLDTGLTRLGFPTEPDDRRQRTALEMVKAASLPALRVSGVYSHLASSGEDPVYAARQRLLFSQTLREAEALGFPRVARHIANSCAILEPPDQNDDFVRPGLALYGGKLPSMLDIGNDFMPVMTVKARVEQIRDVDRGARVSYGGTWTAPQPARLAVVGIGYADGLPRTLSNRGSLLFHGQDCPIRGAVCMDHCIVDITGIPNVRTGDPMMFFGKDEYTKRAASDVAYLCKTIDYELFCRISSRVPRVLVP